MRIALVSPFPPSKGTLNEYAHHLVQHFLDRDDVTELIILTDELPDGADYDHALKHPKLKLRSCWRFNAWNNLLTIQNAISETNPDVVFYNLQFLSFGDKKIPAALGLISPRWNRFFGNKSVVLLHNIMETVDLGKAGITSNIVLQKLFSLIGNGLTRMLLGANVLAVTLPKYVDILSKKYKCDHVVHIPHGSFEVPAEPDFSKEISPARIMTFGKFGTYKKVEALIEATEMVRQRLGMSIELVIAGTDNPNVKGYLAQVKHKYSHLTDIQYTGYVVEADVPGLFMDSTFVVFDYSSTTGSSGVLHQAGSYGKAAILPKIDDLKELIEEEGYEGLYFEPGDVNQLADAIEKLLTDDELRIQLAKKNYQAAASIPMDQVAGTYVQIFKDLTENANTLQIAKA